VKIISFVSKIKLLLIPYPLLKKIIHQAEFGFFFQIYFLTYDPV